jgi:UDP-N-acetylglucosamine 3-dehydrogenase
MTLRAGLVGLGSMGRHHERVLLELDGVDLVGIVDPRSRSTRVETFPDLASLLRQGLDYCVVSTPTASHEAVGLTLAEAGVHALIEKPLCLDAESASRLVVAFRGAGLVGAVGHVERFNPALIEAKRRIAQGMLGEVLQVFTSRQGPLPSRVGDVGVVLDLATHDLDSTTWLTGQAFTKVYAQTAYRSGREHEDMVMWLGRLADGTITSHVVNWLSPFKERKTVITGERGSLIADTLNIDLTYFENGTIPTVWDDVSRSRGVSEGDVVRFAFSKPEPLVTEHAEFVRRIRDGSGNIVSLEEGLRTIEVAEALLRSTRASRPIDCGAET